MKSKEFTSLESRITRCRRCPRLVEWREAVAIEKVSRFRHEPYWGKPVSGFGDRGARVLVLGLAPAAHGGNRTGRVFTGDRSGDWLYRALHKAGFANQPTSISRNDGLTLSDCYVTATVRCAPPANKPLPEESENCRTYLHDELRLLRSVRIIVALGKIAFDGAFDGCREMEMTELRTRPKFAHGAHVPLSPRLTLIGSYHPSQQNTFTGRLTEPMFDSIFSRVKELIRKH